jgi:hypothetical protein
MDALSNSQSLFDNNGRRIPFEGMRVFNEISSCYYQIKQPTIDYSKVLLNSQKFSGVDSNISVESFERTCIDLRQKMEDNDSLKNLFKGAHVPFICPKAPAKKDIGKELEDITLPSVEASFGASYPDLHFKSSLQAEGKLPNKVSITPNSRYEDFVKIHSDKTIVGWYFPQALQEYDIESQSAQMKTIPAYDGLVLSGGVDVAAVLVGTPGLLINKDDYPPVLCISGLRHDDPNLMLCFKAYGHHLEFWGMSQMLVPGLTQVSEQWSGGLTLFKAID